MKIKFFKKEKVFKKGGFHTNPDISWEVVLYLAFALILASFVFGSYLIRAVNKEFSINENTNPQVKIIEKEKISKALQYFTEREKKSSEIINSPAPFVDPSL